jgi:crotonobetainyl-CoA:carnitine CoA-transferase CaiB-like acyl-CoA transferase
LGSILHTGIVPHVPESPGSVRWAGPDIGQHSDEILHELLNMKPAEIAALRAAGIVA